jgi:hypothetical protein
VRSCVSRTDLSIYANLQRFSIPDLRKPAQIELEVTIFSTHSCKILPQQKENMCYLAVQFLSRFMKFRLSSVTTFLLFCTTAALAQQKMLTMEEAVLKQRTTLAPEKLLQLQWIKGTPVCSYIVKQSGKEYLMQLDAATQKRDTAMYYR